MGKEPATAPGVKVPFEVTPVPVQVPPAVPVIGVAKLSAAEPAQGGEGRVHTGDPLAITCIVWVETA